MGPKINPNNFQRMCAGLYRYWMNTYFDMVKNALTASLYGRENEGSTWETVQGFPDFHHKGPKCSVISSF